jgi:hypothetical protein
MSYEPIEIPVTRFRWLPKGCPVVVGCPGRLWEDWDGGKPLIVDAYGGLQRGGLDRAKVRISEAADIRLHAPRILQHHFNLKGEPSPLWDDMNECYVLIWPDEMWQREEGTPPQASGDTVEECFLAALRVVFP